MNLEERIIGDIKGEFLIEAYQRGYRWSKDEVEFLLNDIYEIPDGQKYCLQPVVVKHRGTNDKGQDIYELIDGQQRMTTLYLIMKYLYPYFTKPKYSIEYTTRKGDEKHMGSRQLLEVIDTIDLESDSTNIDELFIKKSYSIIKQWFEQQDENARKMNVAYKLINYVTIIWYEVDEENSANIFTRLNIGKINLTNAELVKALFLSRGRKDASSGRYSGNPYGLDEKKQHEIALEWDTMEKGLHDEKFWAFITNESADKYPVRMELLFDLMEQKPVGVSSYYTFNRFYERFKGSDDKFKTWEEIVRYYQQLQEWYRDFDLYHQIGFLIACGASVKELLDLALNKDNPLKKSEFRNEIIERIRKIMTFTRGEGVKQEEIDYGDLNYEAYPNEIHKLLLLFNVETIRQRGEKDIRFPFNRYKTEGTWSLEHIHAQNSESLKTNKEWRLWLESHKRSLEELRKEQQGQLEQQQEQEGQQEHKNEKSIYAKITDVIAKIDNVIAHIDTKNYSGSIRDEFNGVTPDVVDLLSDGNETAYLHTLSNMALLTTGENAALNNSTFDVKRAEIIRMDKDGKYIPVCTWNVFMKYYTPTDTKLHFWSEEDRRCYIKAMNEVLYPEKEEDGKVKLINSEIHYGRKQQ